jgi:GMP synthase-like glutamine amidotransferase
MHIHYFQHDHFEDLGYIGLWAKENNFSTSVTRFDLFPDFPLLNQFDWLVVLGGKMSVNDTEDFPWLADEIKFIKQAVDAGKTVIGICLGSQLIARALGAKVYKNHEPEMGFWPVRLLPHACEDPVFQHFPNELNVMHLHFDIFDLPEGAVSMVESSVTPCQAFRYNNSVYAFQFHFEIYPQNAAEFIKEVSPELVPGKWTQTAEHMLTQISCCFENNQIFARILNKILSQDRQKL